MQQSSAAPNSSMRRTQGLHGVASSDRRNQRRTFGGRRVSGYSLIIGLLLAWELSARLGIVRSENWPPVTQVLTAAAASLAGGDLALALTGTLYRMLVGLILGSAIGVLAGIALASSRWMRLTVEPLIELLRPLPVPALVPPLILFLGLDDAMKITVVAMTAFFPVFINTLEGATSVEPTYRSVARTFGVPPLRTMLTVLLPATTPFIFAGIRVALGLAFVVTVVAEMIAGDAGIGYYLVSMQYAGRAAEMYAALFLLAICGFTLNAGFLRFEQRILHWNRR